MIDGRKVRSPYSEYLGPLSKTLIPSLSRNEKIQKLFSGDAPVLAMPRLLSVTEHRHLAKAVIQRGNAIRCFLQDYHFGKKTFLSTALVPARVIQKIKNRASELGVVHNKANLQFLYGPDIIRDFQGKFRFIEDNTGFVGGMGDLEACSKAAVLLGVNQENIQDPLSFYRNLISKYKKLALTYGGGQIINFAYPNSLLATHEDQRLEEIYSRLGISTLKNVREFEFFNHHVFYRKKKVSFLIINREIQDTFRYRSSKNKNEQSYFRLWNALRAGALGSSYSPGIEFVNDKELYLYVEKFIRFYLSEKPLVRSIKTLPLEQPQWMKLVFKNLDPWVVKSAVGQGGSRVWIGRFLTKNQKANLRDKVDRRPGDYVAQRYVEPSHLANHRVDLRLFAMIDRNTSIVSSNFWSRGALASQAKKLNISSGGKLLATAVYIERQIPNCSR